MQMEYKVYLNEEAPVPAATKRRWTQNIIGCWIQNNMQITVI